MLQKVLLFTVMTVAGLAFMSKNEITGEYSVEAMMEKSGKVFEDVADLF